MLNTSAYQLPTRDETGENYAYHHHYEILDVLDTNAGPCTTCDQPLARLKVKQHVTHNSYSYTMAFDFMYAHADGSPEHSNPVFNRTAPRAKCIECGAYTVTLKQEAYGDRFDCSTCGHSAYYSIGD